MTNPISYQSPNVSTNNEPVDTAKQARNEKIKTIAMIAALAFAALAGIALIACAPIFAIPALAIFGASLLLLASSLGFCLFSKKFPTEPEYPKPRPCPTCYHTPSYHNHWSKY